MKQRMSTLTRMAALVLTMVTGVSAFAQSDVTCSVLSNRVTKLNNGILNVRISAQGKVNTFSYNGNDMLGTNGTFYYSATEGTSADATATTELSPTKVEKVTATADYAEVVYTNESANLVKQQGYILRKGDSKLYTYIILKGTSTSMVVEEARLVYRVANDFIDAYVNDTQQGTMPTVAAMKALTDTEKIQDATYNMSDGTIYTKYDFADYVADDHVHGVMNTTGTLGVWAIQASPEYVSGGPLNQDLTVHMDTTSPIICQYFQSGHFGGTAMQFGEGDVKMFGPVAIYCNSGSRDEMIADAKSVAAEEVAAWPYNWLTNDNYPLDRSTVTGRISLTNYTTAPKLQVVLGEVGVDPHLHTQGYTFWAETGSDGSFIVPNVRKGTYALHVYALEGEITDMLEQTNITVSDDTQDLGTISWTPTRYETLLWRIGESDRLTDGFCLSDHARAYGMFNDCPADLDFTIGTNSEKTNWYYAQTKKGSWNIHFNLGSKPSTKGYLTLSMAAAAQKPTVTVKVNGVSVKSIGAADNDGSIYRSAMRSGRHNVYTVTIPAAVFKAGENIVTLNMTSVNESGGGVMWDCIKLETGDKVTTDIKTIDNFTISQSDNCFYDLQGRQVTNPTHGLYIKNGKKYIIK